VEKNVLTPENTNWQNVFAAKNGTNSYCHWGKKLFSAKTPLGWKIPYLSP